MPTIVSKQQVFDWLASVTDPEVPVLTILDLGIVRDVQVSTIDGEPAVTLYITPTYSGCPAMDVIGMNIRMALISRGIRHINIEQQLSPAWTTDWITESGKQKLETYGIAPPKRKAANPLGLFEEDDVACPRCQSHDTELVSQFGPTSCKSLYKCLDCKEPFEHFKCH
ncbi:MAG: phenylacetate-CoA oxygenase subunit PaaJ [Sphingobacteriales bacterium]|nr:MAG: phenylacetate-CoA oxygenase subunit PaaJ [Sphingobacteriales bacterium]